MSNWMLKRDLIERNPLRAVELSKTNGKKIRPRRAFTQDELARLLSVAGKYRPAYVAAVFTGLQLRELGAVVWADLFLDAQPAYLKARAAITKNRKDDPVCLHSDVVAELRALQALRPSEPHELVFEKLVPFMKIMRHHLKAADIEFIDARGCRVDFHSLRHTLATKLTLAGVVRRVAMEIMRHSDIRLTMQTYTDAGRLPAADAMSKLPSIVTPTVGDSQGASQDSPPASQDETEADRGNPYSESFQNVQNEEVEMPQTSPVRSCPDNAQKGNNRTRVCMASRLSHMAAKNRNFAKTLIRALRKIRGCALRLAAHFLFVFAENTHILTP